MLLGSGASLLLVGRAFAAEDDLATYAAKVEDLRSIREIKNLQAAWGHYSIAGAWKAMAGLGTPYVEMVLPGGNIAGREALERWLREYMGKGVDGVADGRLNLRLWFSPVVTLSSEGDRATGRWHQIAMIAEEGGEAEWRGTTDVIEFHKLPEGWKIAHVRPYLEFAGPYETGWRHDAATLERAPYHYTPDEAGTLLPERRAASPGTREEIDWEATKLLEASQVKNLVAAYGYYLDRKMFDDIADLFAHDAAIEVHGQAKYEKWAGVKRFLSTFGSPGLVEGELNDRPQLMPIVQLNENATRARVRAIEVGMTGQHGEKGFWSATQQTFEMQRGEDGKWRIIQLHSWPLMRAEYKSGWARPLPPVEASAAPFLKAPSDDYVDSGLTIKNVVYVGYRERLRPKAKPDALAKAEAFDGAENVSNAYGYYIDQFAWALTADLFARNGWKELSYIGTFIGKDRVRQSMIQRYGNNGASPAFQAIHQKTQPYITPLDDGTRAMVRARLWQFNSSSTGQGSWIAGIYENQVKKEDGIWRIHGMDLDYTWLADYATGWTGIVPGASERFAPTPEQLKAFAPDAPLRGEVFAPFPRIATSGFHFANPVSGREPPLRLHWSDGHRESAAND